MFLVPVKCFTAETEKIRHRLLTDGYNFNKCAATKIPLGNTGNGL